MDMSQITTRLWIGANVNSAADMQDLHNAGITHVIDCNTDNEASLFNTGSYQGEITLLSNPTEDDGQSKPASWFAPGIGFALFQCIAKPHNKLLCHCAAGVNRGPSMGYAVMLALGWDGGTALTLIHQKRPVTMSGVAYRHDAEAAVQELGYV